MKAEETSIAELTESQKFDQIRILARILEGYIANEEEFRKLLPSSRERIAEMCFAPVAAGHFYALDFKTHSVMMFFLAGLTDHLKDLAKNPASIEEFVNEQSRDIPEWINQEDTEMRLALFFACFYTLCRTIKAIQQVGQSINELLEAGLDDVAMLQLAVKLDPLAMSSPHISALLTYEELKGSSKLRRKLSTALRKPYKRPVVTHAKLRYITRALHDERLLESMSEEARYHFLCEELNLYPNAGKDPFGSLNRMLRRWENRFRT